MERGETKSIAVAVVVVLEISSTQQVNKPTADSQELPNEKAGARNSGIGQRTR